MNDVKLGVFICDCGDKIASILDMPALESGARELPGVCLARRLCYSCTPDGLAAIGAAIAQETLNRVIVAGCTPRTMEPRFRAACEQAGLDGDQFELVDIREGSAWVHGDDPHAATLKALDLIRMGAAEIAVRQPRRSIRAEVVPGAVVIGGGLTGMTAALTLADVGQDVTLVERESTLGGMLRAVHTLYPDGQDAAQFVDQTVKAVTGHPSIPDSLQSEVTGVAGHPGRYSVRVNGSGEPLEVGAIIVATGAQTARPWGRFRYDGQRVVNQLEFERELHAGASPANVVMILCAGQRDESVPYCSNVCCLGALKQAMEVKAANPQADVTLLFRDLYLLDEDMHADRVTQALKAGVQFLRYAPSSPPTVTADEVQVYDELTHTERHLPYDRVVLASPLVPQADASVVAHRLGIAQDENGFFPEVRYRLRPQNYAERGIYICGAAHSPVDWNEAEFQATGAAFRAVRHLRAGQVSSQAPVAAVDETLCTGCGSCVTACPFGAISMRKREGALDLSQIDPLLCTGCGNCVVTCPVKAISQPVDGEMQVLAQIDAALATAASNGGPRILVFGCEW
ncbi:MAG TPA: 4Fe-4S binding protein, partial [Anaerolineae bacterium]|nr:4Fe-4S binding protein [Anaerolineae bacterium]